MEKQREVLVLPHFQLLASGHELLQRRMRRSHATAS